MTDDQLDELAFLTTAQAELAAEMAQDASRLLTRLGSSMLAAELPEVLLAKRSRLAEFERLQVAARPLAERWRQVRHLLEPDHMGASKVLSSFQLLTNRFEELNDLEGRLETRLQSLLPMDPSTPAVAPARVEDRIHLHRTWAGM